MTTPWDFQTFAHYLEIIPQLNITSILLFHIGIWNNIYIGLRVLQGRQSIEVFPKGSLQCSVNPLSITDKQIRSYMMRSLIFFQEIKTTTLSYEWSISSQGFLPRQDFPLSI